MKYPNFFIVGAPKCGTTALSEYLREHPNIFISWPKEPHFFSKDFEHYRRIKTFADYMDLFKGKQDKHIAVGEASVWHLYSGIAIKEIHAFNPDAKIIVMLRNPIEMVYSLHAQSVFSFFEDESDFETAWRLQSDRRQGKLLPRNCLEPSHLQYKDVARFGEQLERLYTIFPRNQVKVILLEDFASSTKSIYEEILSFLGVPVDGRQHFPKINVNKMQKIPWLGKFLFHPPPPVRWAEARIRMILASVGVREFRGWHRLLSLSTKPVERSPLPEKFRAELREAFQDDVRELSQLLQRELSHWT